MVSNHDLFTPKWQEIEKFMELTQERFLTKTEIFCAQKLCHETSEIVKKNNLKHKHIILSLIGALYRITQLHETQMVGKKIFITGGLGGIGSAATVSCVIRGCFVYSIGGRDTEDNKIAGLADEDAIKYLDEKSKKNLKNCPFGGLKYFLADITTENCWVEIISNLKKVASMSQIHGVFINAGASGSSKTVVQLNEDDLQTVKVNSIGALFTLKYTLQLMQESDFYGCFILCSSPAAIIGRPERAAYAASKAFAESLIRSEAGRWKKITRHPGFIIIRPSGINTELARAALSEDTGGKVKPTLNPHVVGEVVAELFAGKRDKRSCRKINPKGKPEDNVEILLEPKN